MTSINKYMKSVDRYIIVDIPNGVDQMNFDAVNVISAYDSIKSVQMFLCEYYEQYSKDEEKANEIFSKITNCKDIFVFTKFKHDSGMIAIFDLFNQKYVWEVE